MMSFILDGFRASDDFEGGRREVSFEDGVLTVTVITEPDGYYSYRRETRHFQLSEVETRWVPVGEVS